MSKKRSLEKTEGSIRDIAKFGRVYSKEGRASEPKVIQRIKREER